MIIDLTLTATERQIDYYGKHPLVGRAAGKLSPKGGEIVARRFQLVDMANQKEPLTEKQWDDFHALARVPTPPYRGIRNSVIEQIQKAEDADIFPLRQIPWH